MNKSTRIGLDDFMFKTYYFTFTHILSKHLERPRNANDEDIRLIVDYLRTCSPTSQFKEADI